MSLFVEFVLLIPVIGFPRGFEHLSMIRFCWGRGHKMSLGLRCCYCWNQGHSLGFPLNCCPDTPSIGTYLGLPTLLLSRYSLYRDIAWASHSFVVSILPVSGLILGFPLFCCLDTPSIGTYLGLPTLLLSRYSQYRDIS